MKRLIVLTISLLLGLAPMGHTADVAMDALTDGTATVASTWYLIGYNSTTPYRFTLAGALGLYTGSVGATGTRVTKGWFTNLEITSAPTVNGVAGNATNGLITNPMTTAGDLITGGASGVSTGRIAAAAAGKLLRAAGTSTAPDYSTFTIADTFAQYSIPYASTANTLTALAPVNDSLIGYNSSGVLNAYTNHQHKDDAAQFASATASKGTRLLNQASIDNNILLTDTPVVTGNATITTPSLGAGTHTTVFAATTQTLTNKSIQMPEVDGSATINPLTAAQVSGTIINSYGRGAAATLTLPTAAAGMSFIAIVGTRHDSAWKILAPAAIMYADVGAGLVTGKTYIQETNAVVGSYAACHTFRTAASTWSWMCTAKTGDGYGTWVTD